MTNYKKNKQTLREAEFEKLKAELKLAKALHEKAVAERDLARFQLKVARIHAIKEITGKIKEEIHEALNSNYKAKQERITHYENKGVQFINDDFVQYCNGKIDALRGLDDYIDSLSENL